MNIYCIICVINYKLKMLVVLIFCLRVVVVGVMFEINSCIDIKDKIIGKRLLVFISWLRIEKNIGF